MEIASFKNCLREKTALMGIDYGSKRIGIAVSDLTRTIANAYTIIEHKNKKLDVEKIKKIIEEKEVGGIVFGLPLQMNGEEGETAAEMRKFAELVCKETNLPCAFWDERLSSSVMEKFLVKEYDFSREKRKKLLDASAAAYILQGFLDALKRV
ncbi:MAG: Holliday junction resolvase RuvX [Alphaproteobacteria bacterium]|nr:Holliday junction resolvase RuvX [Alphaproteobacteria bacterium]